VIVFQKLTVGTRSLQYRLVASLVAVSPVAASLVDSSASSDESEFFILVEMGSQNEGYQ
jgi:hypothetical protein